MKRLPPAFLLYCLITVGLTYPLVLQLGTAFPHDPGDPALNTWILWWNARTVPFTPAWWNAPAFYPLPGVLSFSENLLGLSLIASPIQWLGGSPLLAYNIVFLLTFPLCALGAYLLALELTKRHDAAFIAGMLFGFAPYRMAHLSHIQVLAAFGMPFALLGLHRYLRDPRPRWLVLFGGTWLLQALSNGYYLLFFGTLIGMWILWFIRPTKEPKVFRAILAAGCIASLPLAPLLWRYKTIHERLGFVRDFGTIWQYGADVVALVSATPVLTFWGWLGPFRRPEGEIFPGFTIVLLLAAGAWIARRGIAAPQSGEPRQDRKWRIARVLMALSIVGVGLVGLGARMRGAAIAEPAKPLTWVLGFAILLLMTSARVRRAYSRRSVLGFYVVAAFVMWLFSLGPAPTMMGEPLMDRGPYALLMNLPGFNSLRVPARFWMISVLCLSVAGAIIFDRLGSRFRTARATLAGLAVLGVLGDVWVSKFPLAPVTESWMPQACAPPPGSEGAVMDLPLGEILPDLRAMYRSISHGRPTVNGYSGYFPPHYTALRFGLALRDRDVLTQLAAHGLEYVVIHRGHRSEREMRRYVAGYEGAELMCAGPTLALFRIKKGESGQRTGKPISIASLHANVNGDLVGLTIDRDLNTRWMTGPQAVGMMFEIDLGTSWPVSGVELSLGPSARDFPRGLRIEASDDRNEWREVWRGTSAGRAVIGAVVDPVAMPLTYDLDSVNARYLRLWLTAADETFYWSIAELKVLGR